jgi:glycosyltransferase involved in cell wall biosynthesis
MPQLSAIVITRNEAGNIGQCLDGLKFCDELIVVDCGSDDGTVHIARLRAAKELRAFACDRHVGSFHRCR